MSRGSLCAAPVVVLAGLFALGCDAGEAAAPEHRAQLAPTDEPPPAAQPAPARLRRLLGPQYVNSVRDLLGDAAAAVATPPADTSSRGLDAIGAGETALPETAIVAYESSARKIAAAARADAGRFAALTSCATDVHTQDRCFEAFAERFGRLAFRRPLLQEEITAYANVGRAARAAFKSASDDGENAGHEYLIAGLLQSPNFLYLVELGDPTAQGVRRLTSYEVAARLSYFLLNTTPSVELLDRASRSELDSKDAVRATARALLEQPQARAALSTFYAELLRLRDLPDVSKDQVRFPSYSRELATSMQRETLLLVEDVVFSRNADFREIFDASYTFVDARLAAHYGLPSPADPLAFEKRTVADGRAGILGHASFFTRNAQFAYTSPTLRGKFVLERLLCREISPPPPGVVTKLPDDDPAKPKTMRQKLERHRADAACASCHESMDGIGLALEKFDAIGMARQLDQGLPIDTSSATALLGSFSSPAELAKALRARPEISSCIVRNLYRQSMGHVETGTEEPAIVEIERSFAASGYRMKDLLTEIVASDAFLSVGEPR